MRIGKSRLNLTAGIRLSKNIFFGDGISGALAGRGIFGTTSQALAISPQFAEAAATFGTTSAAQLPYLAQAANTFGTTSSATASSATFLLDEYPSAAAAYSFRLLSGTYSGPLVRIRKDTGGQPEKDFYPDSNNELSLSSGDGGGTTLGSWIGENDGFVVIWYDQSGSNDATQTTASAQPKLINAGSLITENGKVAIDFNASFRLEVVDFLSALDELTIITVNAPNATNVFSAIYSGFDSFANYNLLYRYSDDGKVFAGFSGVSASSNYSSSSFYVAQQNLLFLNFDNSLTAGSQANLFVNSVDFNFTGINDTGTLKTVSNGYIGSRDTAQIFSGTFQEFIIYNTEQSTNRTGIEININDFYTIY